MTYRCPWCRRPYELAEREPHRGALCINHGKPWGGAGGGVKGSPIAAKKKRA